VGIPILGGHSNPTPLSLRQIWVLVAAASRELFWGLPIAAREVRAWRIRAQAIPDRPLRDDALDSLLRKRANTDGAALFSILTRHRDTRLLRVLVAYESIWDYLDNVSEHGARAGEENGRQLHRALLEAVDLEHPISDYYCHHPWRNDGGYLRGLVEVCRDCCASLPSYHRVRRLLIGEARRSVVGVFNHELNPENRDMALRHWAEREFRGASEPVWYELTAAASCSAAAHVLLVLAAEPGCNERDVLDTYAAYFPRFSIATTMLDSYVDRDEDLITEAHSYISHYPSREVATRRVADLVSRSAGGLRRLRNGHRHAVIVACMVAMYLSKDSARAPSARAMTGSLLRAGGSLAILLLPVLRLWRIVYTLRSA
jgi:tetraprenyl-beta-curcumene synthase